MPISEPEVFMNKITNLGLFLILTASLYSCQKSDNNDLQEAQLCLNTAAAADAMNCVSKISASTTENAYKLRCAAVFISKGFGSPTSFTNALDQIKNGSNASGCSGGTCSGSLVAMGTLNFGSDTTSSDLAFSECSKSGVGIYAQISSIFKIGTLLSAVGLGTTPANLETALASLNPAQVGEVVQSTYATACQDTTNASESTQQYCTELAAAMAGGATPTDIGQCLLNKLNNPAATCP